MTGRERDGFDGKGKGRDGFNGKGKGRGDLMKNEREGWILREGSGKDGFD